MSYSIAANTPVAGAAQGSFIDDLTDRMSSSNIYLHVLAEVGQWPKSQAIKRISKIVVHTGAIIDSVRITYLLKNGDEVLVKHGGDGGTAGETILIGGDFISFFLGDPTFAHFGNYRK
jgi:hypothetical protein